MPIPLYSNTDSAREEKVFGKNRKGVRDTADFAATEQKTYVSYNSVEDRPLHCLLWYASVDFLSVPHSHHEKNKLFIVKGVNNSVVSHTVAPQHGSAGANMQKPTVLM